MFVEFEYFAVDCANTCYEHYKSAVDDIKPTFALCARYL